MKSQPFTRHQSLRYQDYDVSSNSYSSAGSDFSRNTWSSSNRGLVQIGSFRFANSEQDDLSLGDDPIHRFSVIIHDNTDTDSLAVASSHQIDKLHGLEDPNVAAKQEIGTRVFRKLQQPSQEKKKTSVISSMKKQTMSSLQKPRRVVRHVNEDSFDHFCNAFEGVVCREGVDETVEIVPAKEKKNQPLALSKPIPVAPPKNGVDLVMEDRDALDTVFEGVESIPCGPREKRTVKKNSENRLSMPQQPDYSMVDNRDVLERVFDGVEIMSCGPDSSHREAFKRFGPVKTKTKSRRSGNSSGYKTEILDHTCESVEYYTCRMDTTKNSLGQDRDLLDKVFGGVESATCSQNTPKRGNRSTRGSAENPIKVPVETQIVKVKGSEDDMLDSLCNGVEYAVCREEAVGLNQRNKKDLLDHIFEPGCAGSEDGDLSHNENSMVASTECNSISSSRGSEEREEPEMSKQQDGDILDYIFEKVESKTCRPSNDDLSTAETSHDVKRGGTKFWSKSRPKM
ncbi:hypothetical protein IV203_029931 [Nitzschia inconspicua]|uniref:Uncharacterized protein n=1 Tax=Nitzschia inconspicua TaxID=303405 RepID=A0A9K3LSK7_9STRA|nr:hypothetical protein IV203_029931 [Nitzschia inconspicua]